MIRRLVAAAAFLTAATARADTGDPQLRTDHPWYPGELSCSTFDRLFATQAELFRRVTGQEPRTDEQKALASWYWRNLNYWHGEEGCEDLWGKGFTKGPDMRTREYWTGLFAHGFGLCGTTHSQYTAEMEYLLGHVRGRGVGVDGHNSFEAFLTGGPYGQGKWVLLDHDISTIIFNDDGTALLSIREVMSDLKKYTGRRFAPERQKGWLVSGLHPDDARGVYSKFTTAEYLAGYAGPPPIVHLRRGERLRRYLQPGLEDGRTFAFWGRNYNTRGIPGPERSRTWVNQPEKMYKSRDGTPHVDGQARFANAVYTYAPDFAGGGYKEGVVDESPTHVTFEFYTPYIIAATPPDGKPWGIYEAGCRNGLVLRGKADCAVSVSVDQGRTWKEAGAFADGMDLTDHVKGHRQYLLKLGAGAGSLAGSGLTITTVCQCNVAVIPRLKDGGTRATFFASRRAVVSAGPTIEQARTRVVEGAPGGPRVTMGLKSPRNEPVLAVYAAGHAASGNPPDPSVKYQIEFSTDAGKSWRPVVKDWSILRRGDEPKDFWSQSFCYGSADVQEPPASAALVRFTNGGNRPWLRCEAHLVYRAAGRDPVKVTFDWIDDAGAHRESHVFQQSAQESSWEIRTGQKVTTKWVEYEPVPR